MMITRSIPGGRGRFDVNRERESNTGRKDVAGEPTGDGEVPKIGSE